VLTYIFYQIIFGVKVMNYIPFSNKVVPAKQWYEEGRGLIAPHRFRCFDKEINRRKECGEVEVLILLKSYATNLITLEIKKTM
jgi:hypothetical protein